MAFREKQKLTRKEKIEVIRKGFVVKPITKREVVEFFRRKYKGRKWLDFVLSKTGFEVRKIGTLTLGMYLKGKGHIIIPEYHINGEDMGVHRQIQNENPHLRKESEQMYNFALGQLTWSDYGAEEIAKRKKAIFEGMSDGLVDAMYEKIMEMKKRFESKGKRLEVLDTLDHEFGHALINLIRGSQEFGISYARIIQFTLRKIKRIKKGYEAGQIDAGEISSLARMPTRDLWKKMGDLIDPYKIHPDAEEILIKMHKRGKKPSDVLVYESAKDEVKVGEIIKKLKKSGLEIDTSKVKTLDQIEELELVEVVLYDDNVEIYFNDALHELRKEYDISKKEFGQLEHIYGATTRYIHSKFFEEILVRTLDAILDGRFETAYDFLRVGASDLVFFSEFKFDDEIMFGPELVEMNRRYKPKKIK